MADLLLTHERFIQAVCDMMPEQSREESKRIFSEMEIFIADALNTFDDKDGLLI